MKIVSRFRFYLGILIILFLLISYFISIDVDTGSNYVVSDTLLGIIIFHNLYLFILYLLIAGFLILTSSKRFKIV